MRRKLYLILAIPASVLFLNCSDNDIDGTGTPGINTTAINEEEYYSGGKLGTVFNASANAFEQPAPAIEQAGLGKEFAAGEFFFEKPFTISTEPFSGLGPLYCRARCMSCHPGYGHGRRMTRYRADEWGNGYLLMITNRNDEVISSFGYVPMSKAVPPFKPQFDEDKVHIAWLEFTDEWGNKFPDGESYSLIYPEVTLDEDCIYGGLVHNGETVPLSEAKIRLESTIGVYGTGMLDAVPDDSIRKQYIKEAEYSVLNPAIWDNDRQDFAVREASTGTVYKFDYALDRASVMSDAGIWEVMNVTRPDFRSHYIPAEYWNTAADDPDVQKEFYSYYPQWRISGDPRTDILAFGKAADLPIEMKEDDYVNYMIWHRGLAVPAARNLDDGTVIRGHGLFRQIGCAECHRPSWTTGEDKIRDPYGRFSAEDTRMPRYPHQKIWPYTDLIQHRLMMVNDIRTGWCRTTPLWGRGLMDICAGHSDRLHDCRARNTLEAIMWHGCPGSDARWTVENFRKLSKEDRDAIVRFVDSI